MYYIQNDSRDPFFNLALEEYVLQELDSLDTVLILWQNAPSVIIGRFQNTITEINQDFIEKNKIKVVRRITGGGAVYHDLGNLNFSIIENAGQKEINFQKYAEPVLLALKQLGIKASLSGRNDLVIDMKKFSGNAQYHYRDRVLHHGTILFNSNLDNIEKALKNKKEKLQFPGVQSIKSRITNISDYLKEEKTIAEFKTLFLDYLFLDKEKKEYRLDDFDQEQIKKLMQEKYLTWDWNYGLSPGFNLEKSFAYPGGKIDFYFKIKQGIIVNCALYGDFFSNLDPTFLEKKFQGLRYDREDLGPLLRDQLWDKIFQGIDKQQLLNKLLN